MIEGAMERVAVGFWEEPRWIQNPSKISNI
jgi:hypothetical protein